jgi:glycosyltransferase 2 family protein
MKRHSVAIGLLISAVFLYIAFRKTDLGVLGHHLATANYVYLVPASLLTVAALWVRAMRWGLLLHPLKRIAPGTLFSATSIGFMCNNVLPMRLGEVIRAFVIRRSTGVKASAAFATIVVERLFDLFSMIGIFGVLLLFAPFQNREFKAGALLACLAGLVVLAGLVFYHARPAPMERWVGHLLPSRVRDRVIGLLRSFGQGLTIFRDPPRLLGVGVLTLVMWLMIAIVIKICFASARLEVGGLTLPATSSLVVLVVIAIGVMVPSGPGFVGTMQAAAVLGLAIVGYTDRDRALSFSILYHATQWFPIVLVGLVYLIKENLSLAQVRQLSSEADLESGEGTGS